MHAAMRDNYERNHVPFEVQALTRAQEFQNELADMQAQVRQLALDAAWDFALRRQLERAR